MPIVVDASVTLAWFFADERTPEPEEVRRRIGRDGAIVPVGWPGEVANALIVGERRGRATRDQSDRFLAGLSRLPIRVAAASAEGTWGSVLALARDQGLTAYDAAYLELAIRERTALATLDDDLRAAASRVGVSLV